MLEADASSSQVNDARMQLRRRLSRRRLQAVSRRISGFVGTHARIRRLPMI